MFVHVNVLASVRKLLENPVYLCHNNKEKAFDRPMLSYLFGQLETVPLGIMNCK